MHLVARRDGVTDRDHMEIELDNSNDKELSEEQAALMDHLILKAFVMCAIPFRIIENLYLINVLKNMYPITIPRHENIS